MTTTIPVTPPTAPSLDNLSVRVSALETNVSKIVTGIENLADKFEKRNQTQWPVIISGLVFMLTVLGFVGTSWKAPIETTVNRQDADIRAIQGQIVPRAEHADKWKSIQESIEASRERVTRDMGEVVKRIERLESKVFFEGKRADSGRGSEIR